MIRLRNISKSYYSNENEISVLKSVGFEIKSGEFLCITGTSGSGKSTLLNILGILDDPTSGSYFFNNRDIRSLHESEKAKIRGREIGIVFQSFNLIPELSVLENIVVPLGYAGIEKKERNKKGKDLLNLLDLEHLSKKFPHQLSGGEQQRIAILRAIINKPKILLADEPTGNLDEENTILVMEMLRELNEEGMTIACVTHDWSIAEYSNRVVRVENGGIVNLK